MIFSTLSVMPVRSQPRFCATIPIVVAMQVTSPVASRSVGENDSPRP